MFIQGINRGRCTKAVDANLCASSIGDKSQERLCWLLRLDSQEAGIDDLEELIQVLLNRLPSQADLWNELNKIYKIELFCGLFMNSSNSGFNLSPSLCKLLAEREIQIGFDIYAPD